MREEVERDIAQDILRGAAALRVMASSCTRWRTSPGEAAQLHEPATTASNLREALRIGLSILSDNVHGPSRRRTSTAATGTRGCRATQRRVEPVAGDALPVAVAQHVDESQVHAALRQAAHAQQVSKGPAPHSSSCLAFDRKLAEVQARGRRTGGRRGPQLLMSEDQLARLSTPVLRTWCADLKAEYVQRRKLFKPDDGQEPRAVPA